jgi:hypothetical protein
VITRPSCVRCGRPVCRCSKEMMRLPNPIDPFPIDRCSADTRQRPIQEGGDPMVPLRRALICHRLDHRKQPRIIGLAHALARRRVRCRRRESFAHVRTGYPEAPGHRSHSKPSTPRNGCREISCFSRPRRIASFKISFSTVFWPKMRSRLWIFDSRSRT